MVYNNPFRDYRASHNITKPRPTVGNSCPRCYSQQLGEINGRVHCATCKWSETLFDFPMSELFRKAL